MDENNSEEFLEASRFWVQRVFVPIFVFIGVGGNIVTVMILTRRRMRCTTHIYLTALAIADLVYLLFVLLLSFEHYPNIHARKYELYWRFYGISHWICDAASSTSVWLTVSFTIERYIIVCHPIRGKVFCTERRAKNIITIISLLCLLSTLSTTFEHQLAIKDNCIQEKCTEEIQPEYLRDNNNETDLSEIRDKRSKIECKEIIEDDIETPTVDPNNNETCCIKSYEIFTEPTEFGENETYTSIMYWFSSITFGWLPLILIATFNCFLVKAVYESTRARKAMMLNSAESNKQRHENRITILLIGIVVLFLVLQTPTATFLIYATFDRDVSETTVNVKKALGNFFNLLLTINASCNFLMYCVLSENYRRTFKAVFCAKKLNRQDTSAFSVSRSSRRNGFRRNQSEYQTPRNLETQSLTSIPRSKSLMMRPIGHAKSNDLNV